MRSSFWFLPATLLTALAASAAQAQSRAPAAATTAQVAPTGQMPAIAFKCPAAGIAIETRTEHLIGDRVSQGPDPSDPTLCVSKSGFTTSELYYGRVSRTTTNGLDELRAGFRALFAGQRTEFSVRTSNVSINGGRNEYDDTWRRLPNETITIAGRSINAVVFQNDQRGVHMSAVGSQKLWYDPSTGIWVKRQATVQPGTRWGSDWEVIKITP